MKWFSKFLKLRKQNDYVKIMLLVFLLGTFMLGSAVYNGIDVYHRLKTPTEYILNYDGGGALNKLIKTEGIDAVSVEKKTNLTVDKTSINCYLISQSYLENVYHINKSSAMKTIYLTPKAYKEVIKNSDNVKQSKGEFQSKYQLGEENGVGKFVLLKSELFSNEKIAFCQGTSADLDENCNEVRTYVTKTDLDGTIINHIENLGYSVKNKITVKEAENSLEINFLKIKYDVLIAFLCFGFIILFRSILKKLHYPK